MGKTMQIDLEQAGTTVYIVSNGEITPIKPPYHGDLVIKMVQGKASKYDTRESHQIGNKN